MRLLSLALLLAPALARAEPPTKDDLLKFEKQLQAANAKVGPSLACIVVSRSDKYPRPEKTPESWQLGAFNRSVFLKADPKQRALADQLDLSNVESIPDHGFAGGVVIDSAGLVLTNFHSIEGATKIFVHLVGGGGSYADIRAADARCDLAVLKLQNPPAGLKPIRFGKVTFPAPGERKATIVPGQIGLIMAFPYTAGVALDQPVYGLFTIARLRNPDLKADSSNLFRSVYNYAPLLEYESRFNPGASGAALLNLDGELVGLTSTTAGITTEAGQRVALPLDENFTRLIEVLRRGEEIEYGFLGVTRPNFPRPGGGIPIEGATSRGSPAFHAGLQTNDIITRINDAPVKSFEDLLLHVGHGLAGRRITLAVQRFGQTRDVEVTLAKFKNEMAFIASVKPEPVFGLRVEYSSVLTQALVFNPFGGRNFVDLPAGVLVNELLPDSPAAEKIKALGENSRWLITHVNGRATATPADFYLEARGKKSIRLRLVDSSGGRNTAEVTLP